MKAKDFEKKLLETDKAFREAYYERDLPLEISHLVVCERVKHGLTQGQLAVLVGTKQSDISRIECGGMLPGLEKLCRIAKALKLNLNVNFDDPSVPTANNLSQISTGAVASYFEMRPSLSLKGDVQNETQKIDSLEFKE